VILRCFAKQAEQRYADAGVLFGVLYETAENLGLSADRTETARYVRELFADADDHGEHEGTAIHDTTLLPPPHDMPAPLEDVDTARELEDSSDDADDDSYEDEGPLPDWGNLDVFAICRNHPRSARRRG